jgi:hypothetical protein
VRPVRVALLMLAIAACAATRAQETVVTSPRADSVSVTIYRDNLALITETRTVDLPAQPITVVLSNVVDTLLPQTAVMTGAERPLAESAFSFDQLSPASLLVRSIGKTVVLVRTDRATGKITRTPATIVSAGEGVVLQLANGVETLRCSGLPEGLEFSAVPGELTAKPQLSVKLGAGMAGKRVLKVSYLATGMSWSSDYVAHLNDKSDRMSLLGWVTLENQTGTSFSEAQVQVVAGHLNLIDASEGGSESAEPEGDSAEDIEYYVQLLSQCFSIVPMVRPPPEPRYAYDVYYDGGGGGIDLESVVVTGMRMAKREELGDYQLYRLPWATDLDARQTKQAVFLNKPDVHVERFYGFRVEDLDAEPGEDEVRFETMLRWENEERSGLGEPLPLGTVRVFESYSGEDVLAGEAEIEDKPVGVPVEVAIGRALNLTLETQFDVGDLVDLDNEGTERIDVVVEHRVVNDKEAPVQIEIRHGAGSIWTTPRVRKATLRTQRKYGDLMWRFTLPPGETQVLHYELRAITRSDY